MGEALVNYYLGARWRAYSAGVKPSKLNPRAVEVMREIGIDISQHHSKSVDEFINKDDIDLVITVCDNAKENCPVFLKPVKQVHIGFEDPAPFTGEPDETALPKFREVRDEIKAKLLSYLDSIDS